MIVRVGFWCIDVGLYVFDGDWRMNYSRRRISYVWVLVVGCSSAQITAGTDDGSGSAQNVGYTEGGLAKMEGLPYAFGRFGYVNAARFYDLAGGGYYWSGSTVSSANSFALLYSGSELYPADQGYRANGWSVRCVAR